MIVFPTKSETVASLREGGVDAVAGHITALYRYTVQEHFRFLSDAQKRWTGWEWLFLNQGNQKLVDALTNTLEDMKNEGLVDEIIQKYGLDPKPHSLGKVNFELLKNLSFLKRSI